MSEEFCNSKRSQRPDPKRQNAGRRLMSFESLQNVNNAKIKKKQRRIGPSWNTERRQVRPYLKCMPLRKSEKWWGDGREMVGKSVAALSSDWHIAFPHLPSSQKCNKLTQEKTKRRQNRRRIKKEKPVKILSHRAG